MALITEDGSGLSAAESLCSVSVADAYHMSIGNESTWFFLSPAVKEQCLRKATAFMSGEYRARYSGTRKTTTQALDFPRSRMPIKDVRNYHGDWESYYSDTAVPLPVQHACASLALRASTSTLNADQKRSKSSVTIGPISTTYDRFSPIATQYKEVDAMMAPYLTAGVGAAEMVRV